MSFIEMRLPHDAAFKRFVLNLIFVRHLLHAFPLAGIDAAEVVAIEDASANLVDPRLGQRLPDAVWRLTLQDGTITFLLIECQSEVDPSMPFRMLNAVSALYLALSQSPPPQPEYSAGSVPRVKHLTIYSGQRPWSAAGEVGQAITVRCAETERDIPRMQCPVLDLGRWPDPGGDGNIAVLLGRLQRCESPEELLAAAKPLKKWYGRESHAGLAGAFAAWISHVRIPEMGVTGAVKSDILRDVLDMLETESVTWADRIRDEGKREGRRQGRDEALAGERKLLLRQAQIRFGEALAGSLAALLEGIADADRLEQVGEWLLVCDSGDALLARLGQQP